MNAIVKISGKQFKVAKDTKLFVNRIDAKEGSKVSFDDVLLIDNGSKVIVGNPVVKDASVEAKVLKHLKDDKVIVFKKKRRKGYRVKNGHRQYLTKLEIVKINEKVATSKATKKKAETKPEIKSKTAAKKTTVTKKSTTKKTTAKKAE